MAGLFQVLHGKKGGGFTTAKVLNGTDGQPLIITLSSGDGDHVTDKICTRPFAVDFDGDGDLDIVSGNFAGTFALFRGEGNGRFAPKSEWLEADGEAMHVDHHSDPFLVDWDDDGDLDLLSGSAQGGAFLFENTGSREEPEYASRKTLLEPSGFGEPVWDESAIERPLSSTRVWAADVDADGKLDLLVGDTATVMHAATGIAEATARKKLEELDEQQSNAMNDIDNGTDGASRQEKLQQVYEKFQNQREKIATAERTGYVWLLLQK